MKEIKKFDIPPQHGKKPNQRVKPYLVLQYLLRKSDENHVVTADDIVTYLSVDCGIFAERRSIYKDIEEINRILWMLENDTTIQEATEVMEADEDDVEKVVLYDKSKKGFYVRQRHFDLNDIRLLAECVYSAKFIAQGQAERLVGVVSEFVSEEQAKTIRHDALLTDRVKTDNRSVLNNISVINEAMSLKRDGKKHEPEKIKFKYIEHSIDCLDKPKARRKGEYYIVSPWRLLINDGNYYLMGYDDKYHKILTYRVDRMTNMDLTGEPREGQEAAAATEISKYAQQSFSMFGGDNQRVVIRFINPMLDTVIDRFGRHGAVYEKVDDTHFNAIAYVNISDQFFSWICGFGRKAKIVGPEPVVEQFAAFLDKIREMY